MEKKKNLIIFGLVALLAISVFFNLKGVTSKEITTQDVAGNRPINESLFQKKQDCAVYKKQLEDKFEKNNNSELPLEYNYLDKVFYSPKANSCLYVYSGTFGLKAADRNRTLYLADALSGEIILQTTVTSEGNFDGKAQSDFYEQVKPYEPL
jgi:hypothetical protein